MPKIEVKGKEYFVSEKQLQRIKDNAHSSIEIKELAGYEDVAIRVGDILLGYLAGKILDEILSSDED